MTETNPSLRADFIAAVPKAELHLHIEGSLEPEMMFALAKRNGVSLPYASVEEVSAAYQFSNLEEFLDLYYLGMQALVEEQDFYELTIAYLQRVHSDNVRHVEIFFDPQGHTEHGMPYKHGKKCSRIGALVQCGAWQIGSYGYLSGPCKGPAFRDFGRQF